MCLHPPGSTGTGPTLVPVYSVYSTPRVSSTMPDMTPSRCPEFLCRKMFTSHSWRLQNIKLHHPEQLQVQCQRYRTIRSAPRRVESAQRHEFHSNNDSAEDMDAVLYVEHFENIADSESQLAPPPLLRTGTYPGASTPLSGNVTKPWECKDQSWLKMNLQTMSTARSRRMKSTNISSVGSGR